MDNYMHVRCLFCETGKEKQVVKAIHDNQWGHAIFAQRTTIVWKNHEHKEEILPLLPGYVFVYANHEDISQADYSRIPSVIRVLAYENGSDRLMGEDLEFANWLWHHGGKIGIMRAVQVGDRVEIIDDMFKGLRGTITRMNRTRRKVHVKLDTQSISMELSLSYKVIGREE